MNEILPMNETPIMNVLNTSDELVSENKYSLEGKTTSTKVK